MYDVAVQRTSGDQEYRGAAVELLQGLDDYVPADAEDVLGDTWTRNNGSLERASEPQQLSASLQSARSKVPPTSGIQGDEVVEFSDDEGHDEPVPPIFHRSLSVVPSAILTTGHSSTLKDLRLGTREGCKSASLHTRSCKHLPQRVQWEADQLTTQSVVVGLKQGCPC